MVVNKKLICSMVTLIFIALLINIDISTAAEEPIKVGYVESKGFSYKENGSLEGYAVDYLSEVSKYTKCTYEYIPGTFAENLEKLKSGEIDLVCDVRYTDERNCDFEYSQRSIGKDTSVIYTSIGNSNVSYEDFSKMDGKKFGVLKGSTEVSELSEYAEKHAFRCDIIAYDDYKSLKEALISKKIDFLVYKNTTICNDLKIVGRYGSNPFYFISHKGNSRVMEPLNDAVFTINAEDPYFEAGLFQKHYSKENYNLIPTLTKEELKFIGNNPEVNVRIWPDRKPLSYYDENTNKARGIIVDTLNLISNKSGLKFNYIPLKSNESPVEELLKEKTTLLAGVIKSEELLNDKRFIFSTSIQEGHQAIVAKKGFVYNPNDVFKIVLTPIWKSEESQIKADYPRARIIYMDTDYDCADAVKEGKADLMLQNAKVVNIVLQKPCYEELEIIPLRLRKESTCIMGMKDTSSTLISIINKSFDALDKDEINQILINSMESSEYKFTYWDFLYKYKFVVSLLITILILFCIALFKMDRHRFCYFKNIDERKLRLIAAFEGEDEVTIGSTSKESILNNPFDVQELIGFITCSNYYKCKQEGIKLNVFLKGIKNETYIGDQISIGLAVFFVLSEFIKITEKDEEIHINIINKKLGNNRANLIFQISSPGKLLSQNCINQCCKVNKKNNFKKTCEECENGVFVAKQIVDMKKGQLTVENIFNQESVVTLEMPFITSTDKKRLSIKDLEVLGVVNTDKEKDYVDYYKSFIDIDSEDGEEKQIDRTCLEEEIYNFAGCKILVVDSSEFSAEATKELLEMVGIEARCAIDGEEAVRMFFDAEPDFYDIILMDIDVSKYDGLEATKMIRNSHYGNAKGVTIIAITTEPCEEEINSYIEARMDGYFEKPFDAGKLYRMLKNHYKI